MVLSEKYMYDPLKINHRVHGYDSTIYHSEMHNNNIIYFKEWGSLRSPYSLVSPLRLLVCTLTP